MPDSAEIPAPVRIKTFMFGTQSVTRFFDSLVRVPIAPQTPYGLGLSGGIKLLA